MKIHFLENKIKLDTTILAKSSEKLPYYPVENIKTSSPKTKWRTDELQAMNEFVTFDLASAKSMEYFQALGSNISDTAWCYVELADDSAFTIGLVSYSLTGEELKTGKFFTSVQKRYLRLKIYGGVCFVGTSGGSTSCYDSCVVDGKIYVCSNHRISIFDAKTLEYLSYFGSYGSGDGQFNTPFSICSDGTYLYVADYNNYRIQKFTLAGVFVSKIGENGAGAGQFNKPYHIKYYNGKLYIADSNNKRIQVHLAEDLSYADTFPMGLFAAGCWIDEINQYLITSTSTKIIVYKLSDKSLVRQSGSLPDGRSLVLVGDYIYYSDYSEHKIQKYKYSDFSLVGEYAPGRGSLPGQLNFPYHLNLWPERNNMILIANVSYPYYVVGITPDLKFQSNPDGYIEVGRLIAAEKKSLTRQAITKFDDRYDDKSIAIETDALVVFHVTKDLLYRLSIDIEQLKGTDKTLLENFFIDHGLTRAFSLYIEDETEGNYVIPNVRFQSEPTFKYVAYDNFSTSLEVVEVK